MNRLAAPTSSPIPTLDYDELYASYQKGLVETLRGFGPEESYLSLWVPDEIPWKGIWNLFDAAASESQKQLRVRVRSHQPQGLDLQALTARLSCFGTPTVKRENKHVCIEILDLRPASSKEAKRLLAELNHTIPQRNNTLATPESSRAIAPADPIDCPYQDTMQAMALACAHEHSAPSPSPETLLLSGNQEMGLIWLSVDRQRQTVIGCGHQHAPTQNAKGLLETFCRLAQGRPLREVLDHGTECTELQLRKSRQARPCAGVVLPNNAHPLISQMHKLVKSMRSQCTVFEDSWSTSYNEYDEGVSPEWAAHSSSTRVRLIEAVFSEFKALHANDIQALNLVRIDGEVRLHVSLTSSAASDHVSALVARLEETIRDRLDPRLELFLEPKRDQNKLRRLTVIQSASSK